MKNFVREFNIKAQAENFANRVNGTVVPAYDWDKNKNQMIKKWIVKY